MGNFFDLTGHVALVTGGNGGIGLGMARGLAEAGADVAIWGTNEEKNERATKELESIGSGRVAAFRCDVGDEGQVDATFAATVDALGKVDSCFANAGVGAGAPITDMTLETWRHVQRIQRGRVPDLPRRCPHPNRRPRIRPQRRSRPAHRSRHNAARSAIATFRDTAGARASQSSAGDGGGSAC